MRFSFKIPSFSLRLIHMRYLLPTAVLSLLLICCLGWHLVQSRPLGDGRLVYGLTVPKGAGFSQIAEELQRRGMVRSALHLRVVGRLSGLDRRMQTGDYRITDAMRPREILQKLASGVSDARRFAVPEGYSIFQVAELLERQGIFSSRKFLEACNDRELLAQVGIMAATAEGYLFPGTYLVGFKMDERGLLLEMLREFRRRAAVLEQRLSGTGMNLHQVVTLASLVEKEAASPEERPLIASVFRNRLRIGMPLQSDPTAIYGVRAFGGTVTKADLQRRSPYNTYLHKGLPPGPIGNPSMEALQSVIKPASTDYLYFVARKDGTHQFSRTLEEHNRGVNHFLKKKGKKRRS